MTELGTGRVDITPAPMEMGGYYAVTPRMATGAYSTLYARAVVLWDPSPRAIVTVDVGTLPVAWSASVLARLVPLTSWSAADIVLLATHTHNAPMSPSDPDPWITYGATDLTACTIYWAELADDVVTLVSDVLAGPRTTVTLDYQATSQQWSASRTQPATYTETTVPVLVARRANGVPAAVLFGYGCHPVSAGTQTLWDGDYPSGACEVIEGAVPDCHAQFLPGPAGDQDPTYVPRGWANRNILSAHLGDAVVQAASVPGRALAGPIATSRSTVDVALQIGSLASQRAGYASRLTNPAFAAFPLYLRHAQWAIERIDAGNPPTSIRLPIQVWRLGAPLLRMLFLGGEPVSGFGLWARNHYGGTNGVVVVGYATDTQCYVVGDTFFPPYDSNGSYEGGWNSADPALAGESMCVYAHLGHFRYSPDPQAAEPVILAAITAALT